jgi:hypothetical protein
VSLEKILSLLIKSVWEDVRTGESTSIAASPLYTQNTKMRYRGALFREWMLTVRDVTQAVIPKTAFTRLGRMTMGKLRWEP